MGEHVGRPVLADLSTGGPFEGTVTDITLKLDRLASLLREGLLSREQFEEQRDRLLSESRRESELGNSAGGHQAELEQLGDYQILRLIGEGGMGSVYRGRHRDLAVAEAQGGDVAIKVMHPQFARSPEYRARFEREASLGLRLDHPGVVRAYELVRDNGVLGLVMEWIEGSPLSSLVGPRIGPIPWSRAWPMFSQMLDAVGYAHDCGVVHRDIKPENVMVTPNGQLRTLDFGIAKEAGRTTVTATGAFMGTIDYMAPEQHIDAKSADARADIYALGLTLYEMLAGRLPWSADMDHLGVLKFKLDGTLPSPAQYCPEIPQEVARAILIATAQAADDRFSDISAFRNALLQPSDVDEMAPGLGGRGLPAYRTDLDAVFSEAIAHDVGGEPELAVAAYAAAARGGHSGAQNALGVCYWRGTGVEPSMEEAAQWFEAAAGQGERVAQFNLDSCMGKSYQTLRIGSRDSQQRWHENATEAYPDDMIFRCHITGWGESTWCGEHTIEWYGIASELGDLDAQVRLGEHYYIGWLVPKDLERRFLCFSQAAAAGHVVAQYNVGNMLKSGQGTPQDRSQALRWFSSAASHGHRYAAKELQTSWPWEDRFEWLKAAALIGVVSGAALSCLHSAFAMIWGSSQSQSAVLGDAVLSAGPAWAYIAFAVIAPAGLLVTEFRKPWAAMGLWQAAQTHIEYFALGGLAFHLAMQTTRWAWLNA